MAVDDGDSIGVRNGDMLGLDAHKLSILLMEGMDLEEADTETGLQEEPEFRELCLEGSRKPAQFLGVDEVGESPIGHGEERKEEVC